MQCIQYSTFKLKSGDQTTKMCVGKINIAEQVSDKIIINESILVHQITLFCQRRLFFRLNFVVSFKLYILYFSI